MRIVLLGCALVLAPPSALAGEPTGKMDFIALCSPCHGKSGKGDGPNAASLHKRPADLTTITKSNGGLFPEEQVFQTISGLDDMDAHGRRDMPVWGNVFVDQAVGDATTLDAALMASDAATQRIVSLLRYIESIQETP